jgi:hypothetical protein
MAAKTQMSKKGVKHEIKLLSLKRPEVLTGGAVRVLVPPKQEFKLLSLIGPKTY